MYECMYIRIHVCMCACRHTCIYIPICHTYTYIRIYICMYMYVYTYTYICIYVYVCVCVCTCGAAAALPRECECSLASSRSISSCIRQQHLRFQLKPVALNPHSLTDRKTQAHHDIRKELHLLGPWAQYSKHRDYPQKQMRQSHNFTLPSHKPLASLSSVKKTRTSNDSFPPKQTTCSPARSGCSRCGSSSPLPPDSLSLSPS
jgi:hypothetical protein